MGKARLLIVEDDLDISNMLRIYFSGHNYEVDTALRGSDALNKTRLSLPNLIVLDIMLPDGSGLDTCRDLRISGVKTPIILLTAVTEEVDRILGLEFGADDYIGKPFNPRELVARIRAVLRRSNDGGQREEEKPTASYRFDGFTCDPSVRGVYDRNGDEIQITGAEFDLLKVFLDRPQRLISRETLLELTNKSLDTFDTTINVLISRIRKKLSAAGAPEDMFRTVRNGGYQLTVRVEKD